VSAGLPPRSVQQVALPERDSSVRFVHQRPNPKKNKGMWDPGGYKEMSSIMADQERPGI
jgi:hypothetical protein